MGLIQFRRQGGCLFEGKAGLERPAASLRLVSRRTVLGGGMSLNLERTIAPFLTKLFGILSDESITCIQWSEDGKRLVMVNQTAFQV